MPVLPASAPCITDSVHIPQSWPASAEDGIKPYGGIVPKRTDLLPSPIPPPDFPPIGQGPSSVATGLQYRPQSRPDSAEGIGEPCGAEVTERTALTLGGAAVTKRTGPFPMPVLPPSDFPPMGQGPSSAATESQCLSGDKDSYKDSSREWVPCLRCKEFSFDCHGPEINLGGYCSYCHMDRKRCEFEAHASDQNLNAPSSSPNPQSLAINDEMLHPTMLTSNDYRTNINNIPYPQPYKSSSSSQQCYQGTPIVAWSCDQESSNKIGDFADDHSIPGAPGIGHGGKDCPPGKRKVQSATDDYEDDLP